MTVSKAFWNINAANFRCIRHFKTLPQRESSSLFRKMATITIQTGSNVENQNVDWFRRLTISPIIVFLEDPGQLDC